MAGGAEEDPCCRTPAGNKYLPATTHQHTHTHIHTHIHGYTYTYTHIYIYTHVRQGQCVMRGCAIPLPHHACAHPETQRRRALSWDRDNNNRGGEGDGEDTNWALTGASPSWRTCIPPQEYTHTNTHTHTHTHTQNTTHKHTQSQVESTVLQHLLWRVQIQTFDAKKEGNFRKQPYTPKLDISPPY